MAENPFLFLTATFSYVPISPICHAQHEGWGLLVPRFLQHSPGPQFCTTLPLSKHYRYPKGRGSSIQGGWPLRLSQKAQHLLIVTIEPLESEGTHRDYRVQLPAPRRTT